MSEIVFQLSKLQRTIESRAVVHVPELKIRQGEVFSIVGPSGAGKSTLLRMLHFLEQPDEGHVDYFGEQVNWPVRVGLRREIGMVFQRPEFLNADVRTNVGYPLAVRKIPEDGRVQDTLARLHLADYSQSPPKNLSGGEMQRVALARALVFQPKVLLLDEPTANLDPYNVELIEGIIKGIHAQGTTIVLVTHNVYQARRLSDRIGLMLNGEFVEIAGVNDFFERPNDPRTKAFVGGEYVY